MSEAQTPQWHSAFPTPNSSPERISPEELHERLSKGDPDILVVDVRRTDFEDAFIKGAINLPAHSFFPTLPGLVPLLSGYQIVVFHCQSCSQGGRGVRVASWYQDALIKRGITASKAMVLDGGIKGWVVKYQTDELTVKL